MLLFVLYACLRLLIDLALAPLPDRATDQAELLVLRHQVRVLERHVKVVRWRQADRLILAALVSRLPRPSWSTLLVKPETVLRWHRELVRRKWASFAGRPRRGRPSITEECRELIRQLANENSRWGYLRLKCELRKLGFEVSSTIRRVLRRHRIPPAPRRSALTWRGFLADILKEYVEQYNRARPHRSLELRPPTGDSPLGGRDGQVMLMTRLGGLLREYSRAAA